MLQFAQSLRMKNIFVTREIPDEGLKMLKAKKGLKITIPKGDNRISRKDLLNGVAHADVLLSLLTDKIDAEVMDAAPNLKLIANYAVGFDNIDLRAAMERGITVTNTPALEVSEAVAEHAIALIFALAHRVVETDKFARAGKYKGWGPQLLLGSDIHGKTLGIIGSGAIGTALARRMHDGFGVNVIYTDLSPNKTLEQKYGAKRVSQTELLKNADIVSLHIPLLPSTRHLISTKELASMKKTALLINTARGPIVDEKALIKALMKNEIAGAGLDVFECEPLIDCDPSDTLELRKLPNVILTPHTASATVGARQAMSRVAAENILAFISGKKAPNAVDMSLFKSKKTKAKKTKK
jgi:glyoxylate reductase